MINLSFAACGFLGIYHLGAVGAFLRHGDRLLGSLGACAGASAGALVAAVMVTAPDRVEVNVDDDDDDVMLSSLLADQFSSQWHHQSAR